MFLDVVDDIVADAVGAIFAVEYVVGLEFAGFMAAAALNIFMVEPASNLSVMARLRQSDLLKSV